MRVMLLGICLFNIDVDGFKGNARSKKRWMDCVKYDMYMKGVNNEVTGDRDEWNEKTYCAYPT